MEELKCLDCGYIDEPILKEVYEFADADGNRGAWITYAYCKECGSEDLTEEIEDEEV